MVLDSGSSYTYIPSIDYQKIYKAIISPSAKCAVNQTLVYCNCTNTSDPKFLNISLYVGNRYTFYFNNTDYLSYDSTKKKCLLTIIEDTDPSATFWLMGDSFMRAYYFVHDMTL